MARAVELAAQGEGSVEPNPMVGCVIVRDGKVIGEGWHQEFGGPHAEVNAIADCRKASQTAEGATVYVTLEPCSHTGKTPPCADALVDAKVARVVVGAVDPNPEVAGRGITRLKQAGIEVSRLDAEECQQLTQPFARWITEKKPWVIAKWAMSKNGKIATATGESPWISGPKSRQVVHDLRRRVDAILVGIGTVLADDPQLTARPASERKLTRVILDRGARTPVDSQLVKSAAAMKAESPVMICVGPQAPQNNIDELRKLGCEVFVAASPESQPFLDALLLLLGARSVTNLLVEGGGEILRQFFEQQIVDEVHCFIAPTEINADTVSAPFAAASAIELASEIGLSNFSTQKIATDEYLIGRFT